LKPKKNDILYPYKQCAGKDCSRQGSHCLRIHFINKHGWFCDSCRNLLIDGKLADEVTGEVIARGINK
jgi:hypothetical protein